MTVLKGLIDSADTNQLAGTDYTFIDADTLQKDGVNYRIQGINAPEVEKWVNDKYKFGTAGGEQATDSLRGLANSQGFTNVRPVLDENGEPAVDVFGRPLVDLVNENGESFQSKILESGVLAPTRYTDETNTLTAQIGEMRRDQARLQGQSTNNDWDQARNDIESAMLGEGAKQWGFKRAAIDEVELAAAKQHGLGHFFTDENVQIRDYGRTLDNKSVNPFSDSWEQGWIGVKEAGYGMLNLIGETTGLDTLADIGEAGVERAQTHIKDYGTTLTDWRDVRDAKGLGGKLSAAFQYLGNNAALSLPYMAISLGTAAATGGSSLGVQAAATVLGPGAVYTGQVWNEMEGEKNAAVAIGSGILQAAFDRLGIEAVVGKVGDVVGLNKVVNEGVEALVARGMSKEAATAAVANASRKELAGFIGDTVAIANKQIASKQVFKNLAGRAALGAGGEAATEALQEATAYLGATYGSDKVFDFQELTDRALAGAIAGGALGGAFSVPGTLYDAGAWADVAVRQAPADQRRLSRAGKWAEHEVANHGRVQSIPELTAGARARAAQNPNQITLEERKEEHKLRQRDRTTSEVLFETATSAPALWRGATRFIFTPELLDKSRSLRVLSDMFGGGLQKTFSGSSYENEKHHRVSIYKNMVARPEDWYSKWNNGKQTSRKQREAISAEAYQALQAATDAEGNFDPNLLPDNDRKQLLIDLHSDLTRLGDKLWNDQKQHNPDLGYIKNYLSRYKSFNKAEIVNDKQGFIQALMDEFGYTQSDATALTDSIIDNENVGDLADALDATKAAGHPGSHKKRSLNLAEKERFQKFMERDLFRNINAAAKSAARYTAFQDYVGKNHSVINQLLAEAQADGVDPDTINKIASQLSDYLEAESGNYKRAKSGTAAHTLQRIQRHFMMATTIIGLPLATVSSFVEAALTMRALTMTEIFGKGDKPGGLFHLGNELAKTLWTGMGEISSIATHKQQLPPATKGKEIIANLGFYDWDVGAATVTGVSETNPWQQIIYENFFKWTGLSGWTNYTRSVRAAIAGDYIIDKLQLLLESDPSNPTNETQEAREALRNLGMNVDDLLAAYQGQGMFDPNKADIIETNFREGTFNFINDAVALPQSANRPLIYQDPRFALFTQFQGFIATFTANHIPKLWGEYVKRGTPSMKYNAFAVMTTMIMLGFASQYLKDLMKYGKTPAEMGFGPDNHPFLNTSEYVQRGVRASGLLGTGERVLDQFFPLYEQRSDGYADWVFNQTTGESPALGTVKRGIKGAGKLLEGDVGGAAREGARLTPFGTFHGVRDWAEQFGDNWNFQGE